MNILSVNGLESQAAKLLNFKDKLDVDLLDKVITSLYSGEGVQHQVAKKVLQDLKDHPESWTRVDSILEYSSNQKTKFYALQILEGVIKTRWKILPLEQREGIKKYVVGLVIKLSSSAATLESEKTYLNKLNVILVQIVKREWPKNWPTFISDIVGASRTNESLCQNNMAVLRLLSEEVFDFSSGQITQNKAKHLKDSMCQEFSLIFTLCQFVMENSMNVALVESTLQTLLKFLNWIPLGYVFETKLISTLIYKFLNVPMFRNVTLKCLTEIGGISNIQYDEQFVLLYSLTMAQLKQMLPLDTNLKQAYVNGTDDEQKFIQNLAMFLSTFLKEHGHLLEKKAVGLTPKNSSGYVIESMEPSFSLKVDLKSTLLEGLQYLVLISEVEDTEIFKICLEYWSALASDLYRESPFSTPSQLLGSPSSLNIPPRRQIYLEILSTVRFIMISRMAKPEEVLVVENDQGEVVREFMKDTDSINMYKTMRETLVYLTHLDYQDTERIMTEKLRNQVNGSEWSWKNLNTLCWAIGSISGAMHEEDEKRFLVIFIKDLLGLCEVKRGKDNKAIIASNIMYIVGQYPRFLRAHWKFLKTVVNKLFEFMHETHDGVQDMACDTFIKIAQRCRRHFVQVQVGEVMPFIEEILNNISTIICDLQPQQVHVFYEAVGCMISAQTDSVVTDRLIEKCMQLPNQVWDGIIASATKVDLKSTLLEGLQYLVLISEVEDTEIFKICLEYWSALASDLYRESPFSTPSQLLGSPSSLNIPPRRQIYLEILSTVRFIMISRMAKPEEVLVVENDQGEVVREFMKDTDSINMYKTMRETLVYLTHLDYQDTERIMTEKLRNQVNGSEWSWKNLNTLCWAIGSISGAMHEEDEKRFLVIFIKDLLGLCEVKRGKDNKAIIASNIMYIVGQYPRFLRAHWKFLKTVVNKLFEFMHETHDGVQDMACDTFIKIAQRCRRHFVQVQVGEVMPFIEEILNNISTIICDLQPQQVHVFYEAVGCMISAQTDSVVTDRLIEKCMQLPNQVWDGIIASATKNIEVLKELETVKQLGNILKTNVATCKSVGHPFVNQLGRIYLDVVNVYKVLSENISSAVSQHGESVTKQPLIRAMRGVKKDSLNLINCWVSKSNDQALVKDNFIPPILATVLDDYNRNVPQAREAEVLNTMATIVNKLETSIVDEIPLIFDAVFECTLEMINKDFEEFPEHRTNFFVLLQAVNQHCFQALLKLASPQFKLVLDSIVWAFKHTMRNVADIGLNILNGLLINIQPHSEAQGFYQAYYTMILQHILSVVTDTSHTAGLTKHATILAHMFGIAESGGITVPLFDPSRTENNNMTNELYIKEYTAALLKQAYPHLLQPQIKLFVQGLFDLDNDISAFKEHLRDFLIQIKEFQEEECSDLYLEEREAELRAAQEEKRKRQMAVPGILNPHEINEEMQD
eukprot:gene2799-1022_t